MNLGPVIRERREAMGLTQDQLASYIGISKPYLSNIETGRAKNPPADKIIVDLEHALNFSERELLHIAHLARTPQDVREELELLGIEVQRLRGAIKQIMQAGDAGTVERSAEALAHKHTGPSTVKLGVTATIPVINRVAAGNPLNFTDLDYAPGVADDYVRCPDISDRQAFATRVTGDSMEPMYHEDDIVIFSPNTQPKNGDDCFVRFDGDHATTFKRFYQDSPTIIRLQPLNSRYPAQFHPPEKITGLWPAVFRVEKLRK